MFWRVPEFYSRWIPEINYFVEGNERKKNWDKALKGRRFAIWCSITLPMIVTALIAQNVDIRNIGHINKGMIVAAKLFIYFLFVPIIIYLMLLA